MASRFQPSSVLELSEFLASDAAGEIIAVGGRSWVGNLDDVEATHVETDQLASVVEHAADDMTVTVEAGVVWSDLQSALRERGQELPFDQIAMSSTVGGRISIGHLGPRSWSSGQWRDRVLGIEAVDSRGRIFHAGGRVVKNVAGYDLTKLLIGAYGTLGIITQATLKTQPIGHRASMRCSISTLDQLKPVWNDVVAGRRTVDSLEVSSVGEGWTLQVTANGTRSKEHLAELGEQLGRPDSQAIDPTFEGLLTGANQIGRPVLEVYLPLSRWLACAVALTSATSLPVSGWLGGPVNVPLDENSESTIRYGSQLATESGGRVAVVGRLGCELERASITSTMPSQVIADAVRDVFDPSRRFADLRHTEIG